MKKKCNACKEIKLLTQFYRDKTKVDDKQTICRICRLKGKEEKECKLSKNKILCEKNNQIILKTNCLPGCNDACRTCKSIQIKNMSAINNTTLEEQEEAKYSGAPSSADIQ